jgi:UDP-N-acetylmuramate: L-alanyl-gamma-D-glutamyl-meso-diaminopimelate ligase
MRIHVIGVSGTGMGSLAGFLVQKGHAVSGSDVAFHAPMGPLLLEWGVETQLGFDAKHVPANADLVVIGNVCRSNNAEVRRSFELGLKTTHLPGALQQFALRDATPLVVAGTHGKTTTSALCAWLLECAGKKPGFFIGGVPQNFGQGFRGVQATAAPFVVEGDEYDTAFFEKTPKFLHYCAQHAILTSLEHDHVDIYPTEASYRDAFARFVALLPTEGVLLANANSVAVRQVVTQHARCRVSWYQADNDAPASEQTPLPLAAEWTVARHRVVGAVQHFDVVHRGNNLGSVALPMSGLHNVANALAAFAVCVSAFDCSPSALCEALSTFQGSARRQQWLGAPRGIAVYDDFAHHPSAVATTLQGLKAQNPKARLAAVFEARSATACRKLHQEAYRHAFAAADMVLFAPIGRPEIPVEERLDLEALCRALNAPSVSPTTEAFTPRALACEDRDSIIQHLRSWARPGDSIVLMSNGTLAAIAPRLLTELDRDA